MHRGHTLASDLRDLLATYRARDPLLPTPHAAATYAAFPTFPTTSAASRPFATTGGLATAAAGGPSAPGAAGTGLAALQALLPTVSALHESLAPLNADGSFAVPAEVLRAFVDPARPHRGADHAPAAADADATGFGFTGAFQDTHSSGIGGGGGGIGGGGRSDALTNAQVSTMLWCLHTARGLPPQAPLDDDPPAADGALFLRPRRRPAATVPWPTFDGAGALEASEQVGPPGYTSTVVRTPHIQAHQPLLPPNRCA